MQYVTNAGNRVPMGGNDFTDYGVEGAWAFYYSSACANEPASFTYVRSLVYNALRGSVYGNQQRVASNTYRNIGRTDVPGKIYVYMCICIFTYSSIISGHDMCLTVAVC